MRQSKLYKQITAPKNIYNAIYSLESYIFEKHLLSTNDLEEYYRLQDKFDDKFIDTYIEKCINKINEIIDNNDFFECRVYLKAKKYNDLKETVEFRPIHTSSLLEQVCMVAMLSALMFDDDSGKRKLSAISRLLPANFYGNIPSTNVSELFKPWNKQYKNYSTDALTANRNYYESKKFKYELTLDLERFFPSINPLFIYNYILEKWPINASLDDRGCLKVILEKLLFFKLNLPRALKKFYYPEEIYTKSKLNYNIGIAQGLPQAYYFGNICMTIIAKHENILLNGDSYFYVDDSTIFTNEKVNQELIDELVEQINTEVSKYVDLDHIRNNDINSFQDNVKEIYQLKIHDIDKKSKWKEIERLDSLFYLSKPASLLPFEIRTAQDEFEDLSLLSKAEALLKTIDELLKTIEKAQDEQASLKRLNSFRKFYLNRINFLKVMQSEELIYGEEELEQFVNKFQLRISPSKSLFFDMLEGDVFIFEGQIIAQRIVADDILKDKFLSVVLNFELSCINNVKESSDFKGFLYFNKVLSTITEQNVLPNNRYSSLKYSRLTQGINNKNRAKAESKINNIKAIIDLVK